MKRKTNHGMEQKRASRIGLCVGLVLLFCMLGIAPALASVLELPSSLKEIADEAFMSDTSITSVVIPDGATSIGARAFAGCGNLEMITVPNSVTIIGDSAFENCTRLTILSYEGSAAAVYAQNNGILYEEVPNAFVPKGLEYQLYSTYAVITGYTGSESKLVLPDEIYGLPVTGIEAYAFAENDTLESVAFPKELEWIAEHAFDTCAKLVGDLVIPDSVTSIGDWAFNKCGFEGALTLSKNLQTIGNNAFTNTRFSGDLIIPDSVVSIGSGAFFYYSEDGTTTSFNGELILGNGLKTIGDNAFADCFGFYGDLVIPHSVTSIGDYVFSGCYGFDGNLILSSNLKEIPQFAFLNCSNLTGNLIIPDGVRHIHEGAFSMCSRINDVTFGSGLTFIGAYAFAECDGLVGSEMLQSTSNTDNVYNRDWSKPYATVVSAGESNPDNATVLSSGLVGEVLQVRDEVGGWFKFTALNSGDYYFTVDASEISAANFRIEMRTDGVKADSFLVEKSNELQTYVIRDVKKGTEFSWWDNDNSGKSWTFLEPFKLMITYADYNYGITIPDGVQTIGECAFLRCSSLLRIEIPDSVVSIGENAFAECASSFAIVSSDSSFTHEYATNNGISIQKEVKLTAPENVAYRRGNGSDGKPIVFLAWDQVEGADGYYIWRGNDRSPYYELIQDVPAEYESEGTSDREMELGMTHYYRIQAYKNTNGVTYYSDYSQTMLVTFSSIEAFSQMGVHSNSEVTYYIHSVSPWEVISEVPDWAQITPMSGEAGTTQVDISMITNIDDTARKFGIMFQNASDITGISVEQEAGDVDFIILGPRAEMNEGNDTVLLKWTSYDKVNGFYIYRSKTEQGTYKRIGTVEYNTSGQYTYENKSIDHGCMYYYKIKPYVVDYAGNTVVSSDAGYCASVETPVSYDRPTDLMLTENSKGIPMLEWNAPDDASGFKVYRSETPNNPVCISTIYDGHQYAAFHTLDKERSVSHYYWVTAYYEVNDVEYESELSEILYIPRTTSLTTWVTQVSLNRSSLSLDVGDRCVLEAQTSPENATDSSLIWYSNDEDVAIVDDGMITATGEGTATITAEAADGSGCKASCRVTVADSTITEITIPYQTLSVVTNVGSTTNLKLLNGALADQNNLTWCSSKTSCVEVNSQGEATAIAEGSATVYCYSASGTEIASFKITVRASAGDTTISGYFADDEYELVIGERVQLKGSVYSVGSPLDRITVKIEGYWPDGENGANRYCSATVNNEYSVKLGNLTNFILDSTTEPLNYPGEYTMNLFASAQDGTSKLLESAKIIVKNSAEAPTLSVKIGGKTYSGTDNDSGITLVNSGNDSIYMDFSFTNATKLRFEIHDENGSPIDFVTAAKKASVGEEQGKANYWEEEVQGTEQALMIYILGETTRTATGTYTAVVTASSGSSMIDTTFTFDVSSSDEKRERVKEYAEKILNYKWKIEDGYLLLYSKTYLPKLDGKNNNNLIMTTPLYIVSGDVRGIPYTLSSNNTGGGEEKTYSEYIELSNSEKATLSNIYTYSGGTRISMKYGMSCATFVTECIIHGLRDTNAKVSVHSGTNIHQQNGWRDIVTRGGQTDEDYQRLQKGDYLYSSGHVMLVVDNNGSSITVIEQTPSYFGNCTKKEKVTVPLVYGGKAYSFEAEKLCMNCNACTKRTVGTAQNVYTYDKLKEKYEPMYVNYGY